MWPLLCFCLFTSSVLLFSSATRPRFAAYFTLCIYFQTDKDVGIQQAKNMRALAFGIVDDIGNRCQGHYSVSSSFHAKLNIPLGSVFSSRRICSLISPTIFSLFFGVQNLPLFELNCFSMPIMLLSHFSKKADQQSAAGTVSQSSHSNCA